MEADNVFIDSNYFIALFNPNDFLHQKALDLAERLIAEDRDLIISNFIFLEVVTILSQRRGKKVSLTVGEYLLIHPKISLVQVDENLQQFSWQIFKEMRQKDISFVDCSSVAIMKSLGIKDLLSFDTTDFKPLASKYKFNFYR